MGVRWPGSGNNTIVNATILTTAETIIAQTPVTNLSIDSQQVLLFWYFNLSTGTGVSNLTLRIRRGTSLTSPVVNVAGTVNASASGAIQSGGFYVDTPGIVAGQQWSLTLALGAATGNSTVNDACIGVIGL